MTKSKKSSKRKLIVIIGLSVIGVGILAGAGWLFLHNNKSTGTQANDSQAPAVADVVVEGRRFVGSNDTEGGSTYYDKQIQTASDDATKRQLLIAKVDFLLQANDNAAAVEVAKVVVQKYDGQAHAHAALARAYEANGQRTEALAQYKRALAVLKPEETTGRSNPQLTYATKIKELEG
jgi:flagellar basal body-associated protein FliL